MSNNWSPLRLAALAVCAPLLIVGCTDLPTQAASDGPTPELAKGGGKGKPGGSSSQFEWDLATPPAPAPGAGRITGDLAVYGPTSNQKRLAPACPRRTFVDFNAAPAGVPAGIPECDPDGRVHLQLADDAFEGDASAACFGDPAPSPANGKQRKNPNGPQTNFGPTTHYFFEIGDVLYNFVWQCAQLDDVSDAERRVTGTTATLYADGLPIATAVTLVLDVTITDVTP